MTERMEGIEISRVHEGHPESTAHVFLHNEPTLDAAILDLRRDRGEMAEAKWVQRIVGDTTLPVEVPEGYVFYPDLQEELANLPDEWKAGSRREDHPPPPIFEGSRVHFPGNIYAGRTKWEVGNSVGAGAFGTVYEVRHRGNEQKKRLVKFVIAEAGETSVASRRRGFLWNEVGAAMAAGDYVCSEMIHDDHGNTMLALVLEQHKGEDMRRAANERLERGEDPLLDASWAYQLAVALRCVVSTLRRMHSLGWVHRDVKPSNIMVPELVEEAALSHLIDYGTAVRSGSVRTIPQDIVVGTAHYILPEAYENRDIDLRLRDYWAAVLSVAQSMGLVQFESTSNYFAIANKLLTGRFLLAPDLSTSARSVEFFEDNGIEGAHREFIQWLHDFLCPRMDYKQRLDMWRWNRVVVNKVPHVKDRVRGAEEIVQVAGDFLDDDKFVRELEDHVRGLAAQAGIEIPEDLFVRFREFPPETGESENSGTSARAVA